MGGLNRLLDAIAIVQTASRAIEASEATDVEKEATALKQEMAAARCPSGVRPCFLESQFGEIMSRAAAVESIASTLKATRK
jgi:hypothetical protein